MLFKRILCLIDFTFLSLFAQTVRLRYSGEKISMKLFESKFNFIQEKNKSHRIEGSKSLRNEEADCREENPC